jgi:hypothetical protein
LGCTARRLEWSPAGLSGGQIFDFAILKFRRVPGADFYWPDNLYSTVDLL